MDAEGPPNEPPKVFKFSTTEGYTLCRQILLDKLPYEPHDVQIEGICKVLDGVDLFAILATGSGKTGFISMYMLVVLAVNEDPSICPTANFPDNPCILVICPTKYLEHQQVSAINFQSYMFPTYNAPGGKNDTAWA